MRFVRAQWALLAAVVAAALSTSTGSDARGAVALSFTAVRLQDPPGGAFPQLAVFDSVSGFGATGNAFFTDQGSGGAVRWDSAGIGTRLGAVPGPAATGTEARGINNLGQVAGTVYRNTGSRAVRWDAAGNATELGAVQGNVSNAAEGIGINDQGQVAGYAAVLSAGNRAVRWDVNGVGTRLADVAGQTTLASFAEAINDVGQIAGEAEFSGLGRRAVRWSADGTGSLLGDVAGGTTTRSFASAINDSGQATGNAELAGLGSRAVRWDADGTALRLGDLPGRAGQSSAVYGIDDAGRAAGSVGSMDEGGFEAVLWDANGSPTALRNLMATSGWRFDYATGIESDGSFVRILAQGADPTNTIGLFLLTAPVPEPSAALGVVAAGLCLTIRRRAV